MLWGRCCGMSFLNKLNDACVRVGRLATTFDSRPVGVKESPLSDYPAQDKPLVIQINSFKTLVGGRSQLHARSSYDGVVINSNGVGSNTAAEGLLNGQVLTSEIFVLSPQKMGLNPKVLRSSMVTESQKTNDYQFFSNNCVDHVIRPLQQAGSQINLGLISTPRDLSEFCERAVKSGQGIRISPNEYENALKNKNSIIHNAPVSTENIAIQKAREGR